MRQQQAQQQAFGKKENPKQELESALAKLKQPVEFAVNPITVASIVDTTSGMNTSDGKKGTSDGKMTWQELQDAKPGLDNFFGAFGEQISSNLQKLFGDEPNKPVSVYSFQKRDITTRFQDSLTGLELKTEKGKALNPQQLTKVLFNGERNPDGLLSAGQLTRLANPQLSVGNSINPQEAIRATLAKFALGQLPEGSKRLTEDEFSKMLDGNMGKRLSFITSQKKPPKTVFGPPTINFKPIQFNPTGFANLNPNASSMLTLVAGPGEAALKDNVAGLLAKLSDNTFRFLGLNLKDSKTLDIPPGVQSLQVAAVPNPNGKGPGIDADELTGPVQVSVDPQNPDGLTYHGTTKNGVPFIVSPIASQSETNPNQFGVEDALITNPIFTTEDYREAVKSALEKPSDNNDVALTVGGQQRQISQLSSWIPGARRDQRVTADIAGSPNFEVGFYKPIQTPSNEPSAFDGGYGR